MSYYVSEGKKRRGDRKSCRLVRGLDGVHLYTAHMMPKRTDAEVYQNMEIDVTALLRYITERNEAAKDFEGKLKPEDKVTLFHCICYMIAKTVYERPQLNWFVAGRRFWQRDAITLSFVAKKRFEDHAEEAMMVLTAKEELRLADFTRKIVGEVHQVREKEGNMNGADNAVNFLAKMPRPVMMFLQWLMNVADWYNRLPAFLSDIDPYHCTVLLSNLGSIQCDACYHHLNNFGTNSIIITIGTVRREMRLEPDGSEHMKDLVNVGFTLDERIGDGFYFARSLKLLQHLADNPELLENPIKTPLDFEF